MGRKVVRQLLAESVLTMKESINNGFLPYANCTRTTQSMEIPQWKTAQLH